VEEGDFDQAIINLSDGRSEKLTRDEYFRHSLRVRVDQLCKRQVRFFNQGEPVSSLKATRRGA
jgi:hypothetical protein